ncbi:hypothetical protein Tco_1023654 [Tanacetum coccineum]
MFKSSSSLCTEQTKRKTASELYSLWSVSKQMEADDQATQIILIGLPKDIYTVVDSCDTAQQIWLRVQQMIKGFYIGAQEKKAKLFNEWERFNSTEGESIESYYHRFTNLMNDFARNKHLPEWKGHDTTIHQTKNLYEVDYNQLYDFLKMNQEEINEIRVERLAKTHDPLAFMANTQTPYTYPVFHPDQPSQITYMQHPSPNNNNYVLHPLFNMNYLQQLMPNPDEITDPTTAMNMTLIAQSGMNMGQDRHMQMVEGNGRNQFRQYAGQNVGNQIGYNAAQMNVGNQNGLIVVPGLLIIMLIKMGMVML